MLSCKKTIPNTVTFIVLWFLVYLTNRTRLIRPLPCFHFLKLLVITRNFVTRYPLRSAAASGAYLPYVQWWDGLFLCNLGLDVSICIIYYRKMIKRRIKAELHQLLCEYPVVTKPSGSGVAFCLYWSIGRGECCEAYQSCYTCGT